MHNMKVKGALAECSHSTLLCQKRLSIISLPAPGIEVVELVVESSVEFESVKVQSLEVKAVKVTLGMI